MVAKHPPPSRSERFRPPFIRLYTPSPSPFLFRFFALWPKLGRTARRRTPLSPSFCPPAHFPITFSISLPVSLYYFIAFPYFLASGSNATTCFLSLPIQFVLSSLPAFFSFPSSPYFCFFLASASFPFYSSPKPHVAFPNRLHPLSPQTRQFFLIPDLRCSRLPLHLMLRSASPPFGALYMCAESPFPFFYPRVFLFSPVLFLTRAAGEPARNAKNASDGAEGPVK